MPGVGEFSIFVVIPGRYGIPLEMGPIQTTAQHGPPPQWDAPPIDAGQGK